MIARIVFPATHSAIPFLRMLAIADDALGLIILAVFYPSGALSFPALVGLKGVPFEQIGAGTYYVLAGLLVGKPLGILVFSGAARLLGASLPPGVRTADVLPGLGHSLRWRAGRKCREGRTDKRGGDKGPT